MPAESTSTTVPGGRLAKASILLVDDQPANLLALEAILDDLGQQLVRATSGEQAIDLLSRQDFAVVLLDVQMPGLHGSETAKRIRARDRSRHTPIIFLTAHDTDEFPAAEAYRLGAVDYLVKPLVPQIVRAKVATFVELFAQKQRAQEREEALRRLHQELERRVHDRTAALAETNAALQAEVAERRRAEQALRDSEQQFRTLADSIPQLAWMARPDGHIFWYNRRWYEYTGTMPAQMEGWGWQSVHDEAELPRVLARWGSALASGQPWEDTFALRRSDGQMRWHLSRAVPVRDDQGRVTRWFGTNTDISDRIESEAALREADRRKDQFLAMLAHELRNPLAPVLNGLEILRLSEADSVAVEQARAMMERQIRHLTRLVDDLLDVSRITQGRIPVRRERLDLTALVRTTAEDRRSVLERAGMTLTLDVPATPVWIAGDAVRLAQVLNNLLDNAVKFRNGGDRVTVRLVVDAGRRQAVLTVQDQGIGIEPELFPRLFDVFAQADRSLERSRGGLGVGLSVVRGLVRLHGGEVEARSGGPGHGAAFTVRLPLKEEPAVLTEMPAAPASPAADPIRILVVEDNRDAAVTLRMLLELLGHTVAVAYDGPEGVRLAHEWRPDVVLCDIGLPGLDGYGVADALRQDPATARASLIAVTGYGQEEDRRRAREAGFDHHLTKPVDPATLVPLLVRSA